MNNNALTLLLDKLANIENRQHMLEVQFIEYAEDNPKSEPGWTEERLRALESKTKVLEQGNQIFKADYDYIKKAYLHLEHKMQKYYEDDRKKLEDEINHSNWNEKRVDELEAQVRNFVVATDHLAEFKTLSHDIKVLADEIETLKKRQSPEQYNDKE